MIDFRPIICLALFLTAPGAVVASNDSEHQPSIETALSHYNQLSDKQLPLPSERQLKRLHQGKTVQIQERVSTSTEPGKDENTIRIVAYKLMEHPILLTWLATLSPDVRHSDRLREYQLLDYESNGRVWYQYLDLPWPAKNRHWVVRSKNHTDQNKASNGDIWEHSWELEPAGMDLVLQLWEEQKLPGLKKQQVDKAIYLPANHGSWIMYRLDSARTLLITTTVFDMGGWIPDRWVARFTSGQLKDIMNGIGPRCERIASTLKHSDPMYTGSGERITEQMIAQALSSAGGQMQP